ncbi:MAG: hypothetical protein GY949_18325, partial [Gammaproteobacteria bacterium]|nr:hypothetical protein [Gammaproteobacteria bacterium]
MEDGDVNEPTARLLRILPDALDALIVQARTEVWTELALLGPNFPISAAHEEWPDELKRYRYVYQLADFIDDLGARIGPLFNLTSLNLSSNRLGDAGAQHLAALTNLTSLDLRGNKLGDAGAQHLAALTNLTSLDLRNNKLGDAGAQHLAALINLTRLNLNDNDLGDAGAQHLAALTNLTSLNLYNNKLGEAGAQHLAALTNLTSLDLSVNDLGEAGAKHLAALTNLASLNLSYNKLGEAGAQHLAALTNLTSLDLSVNKLGDAGAQHLAALTNLTSLNLSVNKLGDAGAQHLAALTNLTSLYLRGNGLGEAGAQHLAVLTNLTSLNLSGNKLGEAGAKHLAVLVNLTSLNLSGNKLGEAGAKHLAVLTNLTSLDLSSNNLGEAGAQHLAALINLTSLDLSYNNLGDLTPLAGLPMVQILSVRSTRVANLAPLVGLIEKGLSVRLDYAGDGILVKDCSLTHPPPEVVKAGRDAVLNYFQETKAQGVDQLFEAKVLLVGEGRAGKTSLLRRLYQPEQPLPHEDETTKGIDIHPHDFPLADGRSFRLNVWDFGGQEIYHATHQFFFTKRSLYLLLDDTAKDYKTVHDAGFKYWLEVIELLSERSPVLIFQNEKGGRSKRIDVAGIMGRFPNVKEVYHGNLQRPNAADKLREAIQFHVQHLPHIGDEIPAKWVSIRAEIEERAQYESYISEAAYFDIYRRHLAFDRDKARHLSRYLHDLGVFLHFQEHPLLRRTVILENEWATAAVFRVLDHEQTKAALGRFTGEACAQIWSDSTYADMHAELLALMERFELCYPLPDSQPTTWLAPQLLPPSIPDALTNWASADDLVLSYRYSFLPKGLISRLIVRMHRYVKQPELAWTSGALFEREETQLLVQATACGDEVVLRSRGPERKALLSVIAGDLDALNATFGALAEQVEKRVPCICSLC